MNKHELKIYREHYNNVRAGTKTFEIRVNDRGFQKGDKVTLYAYSKDRNEYLSEHIYPSLKFTIGDVYTIDAERVVFSLLPEKGGEG